MRLTIRNWWRRLPEPDKGILTIVVAAAIIATIALAIALLAGPGNHLGL